MATKMHRFRVKGSLASWRFGDASRGQYTPKLRRIYIWLPKYRSLTPNPVHFLMLTLTSILARAVETGRSWESVLGSKLLPLVMIRLLQFQTITPMITEISILTLFPNRLPYHSCWLSR